MITGTKLRAPLSGAAFRCVCLLRGGEGGWSGKEFSSYTFSVPSYIGIDTMREKL